MKAIRGLLSFATVVAFFSSSLVAVAAPAAGIYGKVVNDQNLPIANTVITATQAGTAKYTAKSAADGSYSLPASAGAYSLRFVPPTAANGTLNAYDIIAPLAKSMTVMLTTPMPGRAFVTGNVSLSSGEALATDGYVAFGGFASGPTLATNGDYRFMPTAGTTGTWSLKVANKGNFSVNLQGQTQQAINQDTIANFVITVGVQRIRVVTNTGTPVAGATVSGGVGNLGTNLADITPIEGLGAVKTAWKNTLVTDAAGWVSTPYVQTLSPATAAFTVNVPASYKYEVESFTKAVGSGDITLTLTKQSGQLNGTIKDSKGVGIGPVDVQFGNYSKTSDANGNYSIAVANGSSGYYELSYRSGSLGGPQTAWGLRSLAGVKETLTGVNTRNFVVPLETTTVKVIDSTGAPVVNANVRLTDDQGYARLGQVTVPGQTTMWGGFNSIGFTDAKGLVTLKTLHLDTALDSLLVVTPETGSVLSWGMFKVKAGQGAGITITLPRPTVTLSGKITFSDGTPMTGTHLSFSAGNGGDQGDADPAADGSYTMKVPAGMKGSFWFGCKPNQNPAPIFCPAFVAGSQTIATDSVRDIVIPSYKTPIHVVNPDGVGLANVAVLINTGMTSPGCQGRTTIAGSSLLVNWVSKVTTDANGWAQVPTLTQDKTCNAYLLLTPDPTSRYQTRNLMLTLGDGATNTIVLTIPTPVIATASVNTSTRVVTLVGDNFLGVFGVSIGGVAVTNFRVVSKTQLTFTLPVGVTGGAVTVANGGGSASFTLR